MTNDSLDLSAPLPFTAALTLGFLFCLVMFWRQPGRVKSAIPCLALGFGLAMTFNDHLRLDGAGVTEGGLYQTRTLAWAEVRDARFIERRGKSGPHQVLQLIGRGGETIEMRSADSFGHDDATVIAEFLRRRLPFALGGPIAARLIAMQRGDSNWAYRLSVSPGA